MERDSPTVAAGELSAAAGATAAALRAAGFWHRDLSAGNLLLHREGGGEQAGRLRAAVVDLNRCRQLDEVSLSQRMRDLARLPVHRAADQEALLASYFGAPPSALARRLYHLDHLAFHGRHRLK